MKRLSQQEKMKEQFGFIIRWVCSYYEDHVVLVGAGVVGVAGRSLFDAKECTYKL